MWINIFIKIIFVLSSRRKLKQKRTKKIYTNWCIVRDWSVLMVLSINISNTVVLIQPSHEKQNKKCLEWTASQSKNLISKKKHCNRLTKRLCVLELHNEALECAASSFYSIPFHSLFRYCLSFQHFSFGIFASLLILARGRGGEKIILLKMFSYSFAAIRNSCTVFFSFSRLYNFCSNICERGNSKTEQSKYELNVLHTFGDVENRTKWH